MALCRANCSVTVKVEHVVLVNVREDNQPAIVCSGDSCTRWSLTSDVPLCTISACWETLTPLATWQNSTWVSDDDALWHFTAATLFEMRNDCWSWSCVHSQLSVCLHLKRRPALLALHLAQVAEGDTNQQRTGWWQVLNQVHLFQDDDKRTVNTQTDMSVTGRWPRCNSPVC